MKDKRNELISGYSAWHAFEHRDNGVSLRLTEGWNRDPYVGYSIIRDFLRGRAKGNDDHPRLFIKEDCRQTIYNMKNHYNVRQKDGTGVPDPKFSDYCVSLKYIMQGKSRKLKKNMDFSKRGRYHLTSYGGDPDFGPYMGQYLSRKVRYERTPGDYTSYRRG